MMYQITLPEATYKKIAELAAQRGQTPDEILIQAAETYAQTLEDEDIDAAYAAANDPFAPFIGAFTFDVPDLLENLDNYLAEAYADDHKED